MFFISLLIHSETCIEYSIFITKGKFLFSKNKYEQGMVCWFVFWVPNKFKPMDINRQMSNLNVYNLYYHEVL
jgi:hypothetical protein